MDSRIRLIEKMMDDIKDYLPYPITIETDGISTLPSYDQKRNVLSCTNLCDTTLLLLNSYQSHAKQLRKILFLYFLVEFNMNRLNLENAEVLLDRLEKETRRLNISNLSSSTNNNMEVLWRFLIRHELQHAIYKFDKQTKLVDIESVKKEIKTLYESPETFRQKQIFALSSDFYSSNKRLEELACDTKSIRSLADYMVEKYNSDDIFISCTRLLRLVTMLQYATNIRGLADFRLANINVYSKKHIFDIARVGNVAMVLADSIDPDIVENLGEALQKEVFAYNKVLVNSLIVGLQDWWILHTAQANNRIEDINRYRVVCARYLEISKHIKEKLVD